MSKKDELKIKRYSSKHKINNKTKIKQVELEILVEELRKTVCILGEIIRVQNASIKDENVNNFLKNKLKELSEMQSLGTLKDYLNI